MKKFIKFIFACVVISALVIAGMRAYTYFSNSTPEIENHEWKLIGGGLWTGQDELEYPRVHGAEGVGGEDSMLVDVTLEVEDGVAYIKQDGEVIHEATVNFVSGGADGNSISNDYYLLNFSDGEWYAQVGITANRDWNTDISGFDGNLYGKYFLTLRSSESRYEVIFFSNAE